MKLSIIVPVYNTEAYLEKCLDSLLEPGLSDYEIIAVNDGSTDGSGELLSRICGRFPSLIRPVTTPNGGLGHARNTGLALAKGEFVLFVDSDDYLSPHAVAEILDTAEEMRRTDCGLAVFDFVHVSEEGAVTASFRGCEKDGVSQRGEQDLAARHFPGERDLFSGQAVLRGSGDRAEALPAYGKHSSGSPAVVLLPPAPGFHHERAAGRQKRGDDPRGPLRSGLLPGDGRL